MTDSDSAIRPAVPDGIDPGAPHAVDCHTKSEQRMFKRFVTVFRLAKLVGAREELCLIRNISAGGLKAEVFSPKAVGEPLGIDFGDCLPQPGKVAWIEGDHIGIAFDEKIDVVHVLEHIPAPQDRRGRRLRLAVKVGGSIRARRRRIECQLVEISQGGARIRTNAALDLAERVRLEIGGLGTISGTARWMHDGSAGVAFAAPLPYRQLASWTGSQNRTGGSEPELSSALT